MLVCFLLSQSCPLPLTSSVPQSCSSLTISVLPFRLSLAPLWGSNTQWHIFLWLWDRALHLLSRSGDRCLLSAAGLCFPGRLLVSCPSRCGGCSTQCLPFLEGSFRGQNHHGFCASAAHQWQSPANLTLPRTCARDDLGRAGVGIPFSCNLTFDKKCLWLRLDFA